MSNKQEAPELEDEMLAPGLEDEVETQAVSEEDPGAEPEEPKSELEQLQAALAQLEAKAAENLDGWQRARAEFQNYKRRTETQMGELRQNAAATVISRFLPVLDDFELALGNLPQDGDSAQWAAGIQLVHRKLVGILDAESVTPIEAEPGELFDPNFHEALTQEESDEFEEGAIIEVVRRGFRMGERVLRPSQVRVAK